MTRGRWAALLALALLIAAAAIAFSSGGEKRDKPVLLLLTSLPLLFGEEFALDQPPSPLIETLERDYRVRPIDVTDPASLGGGRLLMMAQPRAQTPENLVALDAWVRRGGRLLLFADPMLEWDSDRPLGDPARPPAMFADTGLLGHWGLRLDAPDRRGPATGEIAGEGFSTLSAGTLSGKCAISEAGLVARCDIGRGKAVIVADADLLNLADQPADNGAAIVGLVDSLAR